MNVRSTGVIETFGSVRSSITGLQDHVHLMLQCIIHAGRDKVALASISNLIIGIYFLSGRGLAWGEGVEGVFHYCLLLSSTLLGSCQRSLDS